MSSFPLSPLPVTSLSYVWLNGGGFGGLSGFSQKGGSAILGGRMIDNLVEAMSTENRFNWSAYSSDMHKILLHDYQNLRNVSSEKYRMKMQFFMKLDLTSNRKPKTLFPFPLLALTTLWVNLGKRKLLLYLFVDDTNTNTSLKNRKHNCFTNSSQQTKEDLILRQKSELKFQMNPSIRV